MLFKINALLQHLVIGSPVDWLFCVQCCWLFLGGGGGVGGLGRYCENGLYVQVNNSETGIEISKKRQV